MFSEALKIMNRNTIPLMIEDMKKEIEEKDIAIAEKEEKDNALAEKDAEIAGLRALVKQNK